MSQVIDVRPSWVAPLLVAAVGAAAVGLAGVVALIAISGKTDAGILWCPLVLGAVGGLALTLGVRWLRNRPVKFRFTPEGLEVRDLYHEPTTLAWGDLDELRLEYNAVGTLSLFACRCREGGESYQNVRLDFGGLTRSPVYLLRLALQAVSANPASRQPAAAVGVTPQRAAKIPLTSGGNNFSRAYVAFGRDGSRLFTSTSSEKTVSRPRYGGPNGGTANRTSDGTGPVVVMPDGRSLLVGLADGSAEIRDLETGRRTGSLGGPGGEIIRAAVSPDGSTAALVGIHRLRMCDLGTGRDVPMPADRLKGVRGVAFHPGGSLAATGDGDGVIRLWHLPDWRAVAEWRGPDRRIAAMAFSPDGAVLASAGETCVRLWNVPDGTPAGVLGRHGSFINVIAFSPDGRWLAVGSWDETVRLWHVPTRRSVATLEDGVLGMISGDLAFSPDGRTLAVARPSAVSLWELRETTGV